jgi:hypothetical protein
MKTGLTQSRRVDARDGAPSQSLVQRIAFCVTHASGLFLFSHEDTKARRDEEEKNHFWLRTHGDHLFATLRLCVRKNMRCAFLSVLHAVNPFPIFYSFVSSCLRVSHFFASLGEIRQINQEAGT